MSLSADQIKYIDDLVTSISKGVSLEAFLGNGILYIFADRCIFYTVDLRDKFNIYDNYGYYKEGTNKSPLHIERVKLLLNNFSLITSTINSNNLLFEQSAIRNDPDFESIVTSKSSDGLKFYFVPTINNLNIPISLCYGLPYISKGDDVDLRLYNSTMDNQYIVNMTIYKKKYKLSYNLYYKVLNFNRPIRRTNI